MYLLFRIKFSYLQQTHINNTNKIEVPLLGNPEVGNLELVI